MKHELKVLVIDDDEDDYFITSQYLKEITEINVNCNWCYKSEEALIQLTENNYDAYFIDYRLGAKTGLEVLQEAIDKGCIKPVILLTGKGNVQIDRLAVENGAYDYLIKGELTAEILERSLRYAIERFKSFNFTCDPTLHFTECNAASTFLLGYAPEELKNKSLLDFISEKDQQIVKELISEKKNKKNVNIELLTKVSGTVLGSLSITYFDLPNEQSYWQGIILDETIRTQAEQAKLQKEKLEATYRLIRTLAHEIRNPLTNIGLSLEGIEEKKTEEQSMFIDIIKRSSSRINSIISELLQSSKKIDLRLELTDIVEVVKDAIEIADDRIKLKNIIVETMFPTDPIIKKIDIEKITITLINLIVNAVEAMEANTGQLSVGIEHTTETTQIIVKDNGSGISEENLKNLFEPYFTTKKTGMGLGLLSALNIIKAHNADIKVESKENKGTTFKIVFSNS
jgi:PAS domain S-box-containing protein